MLQQTRVAAVLQHYKSFLERFPTVEHLAAAQESEVLAVWSGLGYYRRARMLHCAAKQLVTRSAGLVPASAEELRRLPGIGRYTANAIASIAYGEKVAVVDGNVERVLSRILGRNLKKEEYWRAAQDFLDSAQPGDFNQAMMELGATICVPGIPFCSRCPVQRQCTSRELPPKKTAIPRSRLRRSAALLLHRRGDTVLLRLRSQNERLMPGMWELPQSAHAISRKPLLVLKHSITTTDWTIRVFACQRMGVTKEMH
ncbi:MAG TPA: hypothetical protein VG498_04285, partial [Terriglobales bacterium]|nr:hypothetical protein [Terriglobales bacterium]